ncbi:MAG TPA: hypothetical protein VE646_03505, partial [Actinomycetota bacterium]|nr:hypothetical protein [Actinomycetota bacterium]
LCEARLQLAVQDRTGTPSYLSTPAREPTGAMLRLLRHRDPECRFPGCRTRAYLKAHHMAWVSRGGPTTLSSLVQPGADLHLPSPPGARVRVGPGPGGRR